MSPYMVQAQQKWTVTPVANAGGYPGSPYLQDHHRRHRARRSPPPTIASSSVVPAFSGQPEQLWRIDQLTDGTYRVIPRAIPNSGEPLALSAIGSSKPTLGKFAPASDRQRWLFKVP